MLGLRLGVVFDSANLVICRVVASDALDVCSRQDCNFTLKGSAASGGTRIDLHIRKLGLDEALKKQNVF